MPVCRNRPKRGIRIGALKLVQVYKKEKIDQEESSSDPHLSLDSLARKGKAGNESSESTGARIMTSALSEAAMACCYETIGSK